jgi:hypothetical protein
MGFYIQGENQNWAVGGNIPVNATFSNNGLTLNVHGIVLDIVETLGLPLNLNKIENQEQAKRRAIYKTFLQ